MKKPPDPETPEQWQSAVDAAHALLAIESAKMYGLITGGPIVNPERAEEIIKRGRQRGITPSPDAIDRFLAEINGPKEEKS